MATAQTAESPAAQTEAPSATPLLRARGLSLDVPYYQPKTMQLKSGPSAFVSSFYWARARRKKNAILEDISFDLMPGDRLGIIGENGSGKTSLLRMLANVYAPSGGTLDINGTVTGMFTITLGMSQEATGLENIYLRGMQMGLRSHEVKALVPNVIAFASLEDEISRPINTYSTGMLLRLAFAISTMITPDILVLDEWIGSGDVRFRKKADDRMRELVGNTRGLILASHSDGLLKNVCNRGLVLRKGRITFNGDIEEALEFYNSGAKD